MIRSCRFAARSRGALPNSRGVPWGAAVFWLGLLLASPLCGQSPAAGLSGAVTSSAGKPVAGAKVTVNGKDPDVVQSAITDAGGEWRVELPAGRYDIRFEAPGWTPRELADVASPGTVAMALTPDGPAPSPASSPEPDNQAVVYHPIVDPERTQLADSISAAQLTNLPLDLRNYLSLAALTPGVAEVNDYVGLSDAPLVQAPQSGLSFGGNNGRGNVFWLDGGENYINSGGARPSISQEAVAEFHIDRSNYSAEFGGGIGGIVNIVSKAGTNQVHGEVFGFLRYQGLQARNYFDPGKQDFTRSQVGGTFGAPVRKNKTFVFLAFERLQREQTNFVSAGVNPASFGTLPPIQRTFFDYLKSSTNPLLNQAAQAEAALLTTTFPQTVALFAANRGTFSFSEASALGSLRLDHRFSDNHNFFLRFNASSGFNQDPVVVGLNGISRGLVSDFSDQTLMLNDTFVLSERWISESRLSFNRTRFNIGDRDRIGPSIEIAGAGNFGRDWLLPSHLAEWHGQAQQHLFYLNGRHSLRFGADINPVRDATFVGTNLAGRFLFGSAVPLGAFFNIISGIPSAADIIGQSLAQAGQGTLANTLNTPLTALQHFNLGIPLAYIQGFGNPAWTGWFRRYNFFINDVIRIHPRLTLNAGVRYELEADPEVLGTDLHDIAPRVGLAWSVTGDRKTVLRAGYGIFYLQNQAQIAAATSTQSGTTYAQLVVPLSGEPGTFNPATGLPVSSADIYQRLAAQGIIGTRTIQPSDLTQFGIVPGPQAPFQVLFQKPVNFVRGYAQQASLEVERAISDVSVSLSYNFNRGAHLPRLRDLNAAHGPPDALGEPTIVPRNPFYSQLPIFESSANSFYHSLTLHAARRFAPHATLDAHYTFSKSIDEATDINFLPNDSLNARKDRGLSTFDQRHRAVASGVFDLPARLRFSPIAIVTSGRPFNVITGQDYNSPRPAGAGRNIGHGPGFFTLDGRVSRRFRTERTTLEVIAEGFNLLNRTNFWRLNNSVGNVTVNQLPKPLVGVRGDPLEPLSFVSAFDPRRIQLALKLTW